MSFKFNPFSSNFDSTNPSGYLNGDLEVTGKLTVTQTISSPTFDSAKVNSTYTTVNTNSASWGAGGSTNLSEVATASGRWNNTYTTVNTNSGSWGTGGGSVNLTEVANASGTWNTAYSNVSSQPVNTNSNVAFNQVTIGANTFFNQPVAGAIGVNLIGGERFRFDYSSGAFRLEGVGTNIAFAPSNTTGPGITRQNLGLGTAAQLSSGAFAPTTIYQDITGNWNSTYTTVNTNSASWGAGGSSVNISEVAAASASWNSTTSTVNVNSGSWNRATSAAVVRMLIQGSGGLTNTNNSTDTIIPFNSLQVMTDSNVLSASIANENVLIREPGLYHFSARYASFDMVNGANFMRVQLRSSTSGVITNAAGGTVLRAVEQGAIGTGGNGEATKQGSDFIYITTAPTWIVATFLHSGATGGNGSQGFPVSDNTFGNQPQLTVMKVRDI